jgi:nitrogen fixation NifU-like protein
MADLTQLYRAVVLDHGKRPRNRGRLAGPTHGADGENPLCGDTVHVDLEMDGETVRDVAFEGAGCVIAMASASLMTERLKGRTRSQACALADRVEDLCAGRVVADGPVDAPLGELEALTGVRQYPVRVKCATLAWQTMRRALAT